MSAKWKLTIGRLSRTAVAPAGLVDQFQPGLNIAERKRRPVQVRMSSTVAISTPHVLTRTDLKRARCYLDRSRVPRSGSLTLGALAIDDRRHDVLRETARVFLATGGGYIATADQLILHRKTAQYRIRKAEELRGRPLQERRLDVELALLACHWLGRAALQPVR